MRHRLGAGDDEPEGPSPALHPVLYYGVQIPTNVGSLLKNGDSMFEWICWLIVLFGLFWHLPSARGIGVVQRNPAELIAGAVWALWCPVCFPGWEFAVYLIPMLTVFLFGAVTWRLLQFVRPSYVAWYLSQRK